MKFAGAAQDLRGSPVQTEPFALSAGEWLEDGRAGSAHEGGADASTVRPPTREGRQVPAR
jgi:hypothetical protein